MGNYRAAETCARRAMASLPQPLSTSALDVLDVLVRSLLANGEGWTTQALDLAQQAAALAALAGEPLRLVHQRNLALVLLEQSQRDHALITTMLEEVVAARENAGEPNALVESLADAAEARQRLGDSPAAVRLVERAEQMASGLDLALTQARLDEVRALALEDMGSFEAALAPLTQALARRELLAPNHPDTALSYGLTGDALTLNGQLFEAREAYRTAVARLEARLGSGHPLLVRWLGRLAGAEEDLGDLAAALDLHQRAADLALEILGPDHQETASRLNDYANARLAEGDFAAARRLYDRALSNASRLAEPDRSMTSGTVQFNLAEVALGEADLDRALEAADRALALWTASYGSDHPFVALALSEVAEVRRRRGELDAASRLLSHAFQLRRATLGDEHPATARTARQIAELAFVRGELSAAESAIAIAVRTLRRTTSVQPDEAARILTIQARVQTAKGRDTLGAIGTALAAEATSRDYLRQAVRYLAERDALRLSRERPRALDLALSIAATHSLPAASRRQVFDAAVRSRALVLDTIAARAHAGAAEAGQEDLQAALDSRSRRLTNLLYRGPSGPLEAFTAQVDQARIERDRAERDLALANADFRREVAGEHAGFAEILAALPPDATLVSLTRYEQPAALGQPPSSAATAYLAFVSRPGDDAPTIVPLGSGAAMDEAILAWQAAARDIRAAVADGRRAERSYRLAASRLRDRLWRPIASQVKGHRVFVVGDSLTQVVSLGVLPAPRDRYLLETGLTFQYLSAERDLLRTRVEPTNGSGLLAVGAPAYSAALAEVAAAAADYLQPKLAPPAAAAAATSGTENTTAVRLRGRRSACGALDTLAFADLPESGAEARAITELWRRGGSSPARLLAGATASAALFTALAPGQRVLHIATHGFFQGGDCGVASAAPGGGPPSENPMLLAGLAFAGANRRRFAEPRADDGILTAEEISRLSLDGVEWVVLSACDTGRGRIEDREGVLGLRRAFEVAGARSILTSLWPVDDAHTRDWMAELYRARLERHLDTADAASAASLALIRRLRSTNGSAHPALWGAFITTGDWR